MPQGYQLHVPFEGKPAPDHATFARFISLHFAQCSKKTLAEVSKLLYSLGEISGKSIFIDGTKIESVANKYTFVWKKKPLRKIRQNYSIRFFVFVEECENLYGFRIAYNGKVSLHTLKRLRKSCAGSGRRKGLSLFMEPDDEKHTFRNRWKLWKLT